MLVSRSDIACDSITKYARPFMKVPIDGYLNALSIEPCAPQIALINALNSPNYRFVCAALSRRIGKTYIANIIGQVISLVPSASVLIMSPNYSLSQISFELQRGLIEHFDLEVSRNNAKDKVIEMSNGATIRMGSVNQVDSSVGRSYDLIIFDEAALTSAGEEAFNRSLRPTLDKVDSKCVFISTPRGKLNWFSKFYERGFSDEFPQWCSIHATWEDNPRTRIEDIEEARNTSSRAEFLQEYEACFTVFEGQVWSLPPTSVTDMTSLDTSRMDIVAGLDVGFRDPTSFVVVGYCWDTEKFHVLDEYEDNELTTEAQASNIRRLMDKWDVDYVYIDSAAAQTRYDFAQLYDISCMNAKKSKLDGISCISGLVENGSLLVHTGCDITLGAMDQYRWKVGSLKEDTVHDDACHMADALRYAIYSFETNQMSF